MGLLASPAPAVPVGLASIVQDPAEVLSTCTLSCLRRCVLEIPFLAQATPTRSQSTHDQSSLRSVFFELRMQLNSNCRHVHVSVRVYDDTPSLQRFKMAAFVSPGTRATRVRTLIAGRSNIAAAAAAAQPTNTSVTRAATKCARVAGLDKANAVAHQTGIGAHFAATRTARRTNTGTVINVALIASQPQLRAPQLNMKSPMAMHS